MNSSVAYLCNSLTNHCCALQHLTPLIFIQLLQLINAIVHIIFVLLILIHLFLFFVNLWDQWLIIIFLWQLICLPRESCIKGSQEGFGG